MGSSGSRRNSPGSPRSLNGPAGRLLAKLAARRVEALEATKKVQVVEALRPLVPHSPHPVQAEFLALEVEEAFYGGAAGGGKSDAALMAALRYVDVPNYSAAIFRRTKPDLVKPGAILDRAHKWLAGTSAKWCGENDGHGYRFPSGAFLHFGYATNFSELVDRYQGPEFQHIGVDELTQWEEKSYRYLFSRLRRLKDAQVPICMRGYGNPGGRGHKWVKERFVEHARHARGTRAKDDIKARKGGHEMPAPRLYTSPPSPEALEVAALLNRRPQGAVFVPAFAQDNAALDVAQYRAQLVQLTVAEREMLEHGNWDADTGSGLFKAEYFQYADAPPPGLRWIRYWDLAATKQRPDFKNDPDWTAGAKMALEYIPLTPEESALPAKQREEVKRLKYRVWIADMRHFREDPGETEQRVAATTKQDGFGVVVIFEQEPGASGKTTVHNYKTGVCFGFAVEGYPKTGPKEAYWKPLSAQASAKNVTLIRGPWNQAFVDELTALGTPGVHDDQADAAGTGLAILSGHRSDLQRLYALATL